MDISKNNVNPTMNIGGDNKWGSYSHTTLVHKELLRILQLFHFTQHQRDHPRLGRPLHLFCANKPAIVQNMYTAAGISDHDVSIADCYIKPNQNRKKQEI